MGATCSSLVCIRGKNFCIRHTLFSPMWVCLYWPLLFYEWADFYQCPVVKFLPYIMFGKYNRLDLPIAFKKNLWYDEFAYIGSLIYQISVIHTTEAFNIECYQHSFRWGFSFSCSLYVIGSRICVAVPLTWFKFTMRMIICQ